MGPTKLTDHLDEPELRQRMKAAKDLEHFRRWQSIFLMSRGLPPRIVAEYVGSPTVDVHRWVAHYNHFGPDGLDGAALPGMVLGMDHLP